MHFIERLRTDAFGGPISSESSATASATAAGAVEGWMDHQFPDVFKQALQDIVDTIRPRVVTILEVGTWKGKSACTMASIAKSMGIPVRIVCVDTWLGAPEFWTWGFDDPSRGGSLRRHRGYPRVYETFLETVEACGHADVISPLPLSSVQAADVLAFHGVTFDLMYIDGAHEYDAVAADLNKFWPLLVERGIMLGDDYDSFWKGVVRAVDEFACARGLRKDITGVVWTLKHQQ